MDLGRITSIEFNHKQLEVAKTGQEVCIKIENTCGGAPKLLGRHFTEKDPLISKVSYFICLSSLFILKLNKFQFIQDKS